MYGARIDFYVAGEVVRVGDFEMKFSRFSAI